MTTRKLKKKMKEIKETLQKECDELEEKIQNECNLEEDEEFYEDLLNAIKFYNAMECEIEAIEKKLR